MSTELGKKIKKHRLEKKLSLDKLGEMTGSSKSYLWELENRSARKPSGEKLNKIAKALGITIDYLVDAEAQENDDVLKEAFFRKFNRLEKSDKEKIEQMIEMWSKKEDVPA